MFVSGSKLSLTDLLQPIKLETFLGQYWEQKPLHVLGQGRKDYAKILSIQDLDAIFSPSMTTLSLAKNGSLVPQNPSQKDVFEAFCQGKTLFIKQAQNHWKSIGMLCRDVEAILHHPVGATIVLSPQDSQGLSLHFDDVDVFVLQIEGEKHWQIYQPLQHLPQIPLDKGGYLSEDAVLSPPVQEVHLHSGDLLYIPRGFPHQAHSNEKISLHVSIYVNVVRWKDLITQVVEVMSEECVELHKSLPVGFLASGRDTTQILQEFQEKLKILSESTTLDLALRQLATRAIQQMQPLPDEHFVQLSHLETIELDTVLKKRLGMICYVFQHGSVAEISFPGGRITGPAYLETAFRFIADASQFTIKDLPNKMSDNSKLVLCRRLVREGLLKVSAR
jgi:ribosomal protein L16 Arg81 hydroxylase